MNSNLLLTSEQAVQTECFQRKSAPRRGQRGFDLIQLAVVVGVIGVMMAGALVGVPRVMNGMRANSAIQDLQTMITMYQTGVATGTFSFPADRTVPGFLAHGFINPSVVVNNADMRGRFGGNVVIAGATANYGTLAVNVTYPNVPTRSCPSIVMSIQDSVSQIKVGATELKSDSTPFDGTKVNEACQSIVATGDAPSTKPVDLIFVVA